MKIFRLHEILHDIDSAGPLSTGADGLSFSEGDTEFGSVHYRAQEVKAGGLFVAIPGLRADGHDYIPEAVRKGAVAVVAQRPVQCGVPVIQVSDSRQALALIAAEFYGRPSERMVLIGVTGTNGKTTTAFLIESILRAAGMQTGMIGTLYYRFREISRTSTMTTPESLELQQMLAAMLQEGVTHVVLEISSHAIDLMRVKNVWLDMAVFTNLSRDHLDYHHDMQSYWNCKKRLFTSGLCRGPKQDRALAVINADHEKGRELLAEFQGPGLAVGSQNNCQIKPLAVECNLHGIEGRIETPEGVVPFWSSLVGRHNLENILCAVGAGIGLGIPAAAIREGIERVAVVAGRLERIDNDQERFVFVDYAHTPDALAHALGTLRPMNSGRLICVFGCGGDRDPGKRPLMGEIAGNLSDLSIVTSDNPRTEDPLAIIDQILAGVRRSAAVSCTAEEAAASISKQAFMVEPDRRQAISLGIRISLPGDTILIAGKGHEAYQIIGTRTVAFDDREEARKALADLAKKPAYPRLHA